MAYNYFVTMVTRDVLGHGALGIRRSSRFGGVFSHDAMISFLKAEANPLYQKKDHLQKENYRPVNILPTLSKIFEHQLSIQLHNHLNQILDPTVSAYREKYGCQNILLNCIDQWRTSVDENECVGTIFMDLSKCCNCMPHAFYLSVNYTRNVFL